MKPLIIHLIGDKLPGGSNLYVKRLVESELNEQYEFIVATFREFKQIARDRKPDLIVFHYPCKWRNLPKLMALKAYGKLIIVDHHYCPGFEQNCVSSLWRFHLMLKLAYAQADGVICVSQIQRDWILSYGLTPKDKVTVIPVSVNGGAAIENLLDVPPKKLQHPLVIGAYGRFAYQKGFDVLLKAISLLSPQDFFLYLGGYGFELNSISELARDLPNVKLVGAVTDIPTFLSGCDAVVIPSRWETGSIVCMEAKAAAKPIVASDVDTFPQLVGKSGLLVPPDDSEALANAIASLPTKDLIGWGQAARESIMGSWQNFLADWNDLLSEVVSCSN